MNISRFAFLRSAVLAAPLALACAGAAWAATYQEAPDLADMVKAGKLPAVAERLPDDPMVVTPQDSVGTYGGTWHATMLGPSDHWWLIKTVSYESLIRFDPNTGKLIPNLAESFQANADATEFTFTLRKGLKWSDGEPYTTDDILFWYNDVLNNKDLNTAVPDWLRTPGGPVSVEKVDDLTVKFKFKEPNGLFLLKLASNSDIGDAPPLQLYPKHYLSKFLPTYNPDADKLAKEAGASGWVEYFGNLTGPLSRWRFTGMPTMLPWVLTSPYDQNGHITSRRNPYYFKVDTAGNQLPYLDGYDFRVVQDPESMVLRAIAGEIDLQDRTIATFKNKAVLYDNQQKGDYHFFDVPTPDHNQMTIYFNLNDKDQKKRTLFNQKDFRIALSYAIDRQRIIDTVYLGQGEPWQSAPRKQSVHYDEEMAKQYTEHDPAKANKLLDDLGYTKRDGSGFRLTPDGDRLAVAVAVPTDFRPDWTDVVELVKQDWQAVGVDLQVRPLGRALIFNRSQSNDNEAFVFLGNGGLDLDMMLEPDNFMPHDVTGYRTFALLWSNYFDGRQPSEEPPEYVKKQFDARRRVLSSGDPEVQAKAMDEIVQIAKQQFYTIGIALPAPGYGIESNAMHNVPQEIVNYGPIPYIGVTNPEQFYKSE